jgi:hypothetical protein
MAQLPILTVPDHSGTPRVIAEWSDTLGLIINGGGGSGNISGTLTSGNIPVATAAHTLGDGSLLDDGAGNVSIGSMVISDGNIRNIFDIEANDFGIFSGITNGPGWDFALDNGVGAPWANTAGGIQWASSVVGRQPNISVFPVAGAGPQVFRFGGNAGIGDPNDNDGTATMQAGALVVKASAPTAAAAQVAFGKDVQSTVGAAGAASALPATPSGYLKINVAGTNFVIPYFAAS